MLELTSTYASGDGIPSVAPARWPSRRGLLAAGLLGLPLSWLLLRQGTDERPMVKLDFLARHRSLADALARARSYGKPLLVTDPYEGRDAIADLWLSGDVLAQVVASLCEFCWYDVAAVSELVDAPADSIEAPMVVLETWGKALQLRPLHVRPYHLPTLRTGKTQFFCGSSKIEAWWPAEQESEKRRSMRQRLRELRSASPRRSRMLHLTRLLAQCLAPDLRALQQRAQDAAATLSERQRQRVERDLAEGKPLSDPVARVAAMIALAAATTVVPRKRRFFYQTLAEAGDVTRQRDALTLLFAEEPSAIPDVVELLQGAETDEP